jgi:hypothetical protein
MEYGMRNGHQKESAMETANDRHEKSNGQGQGMNFVRIDLRLALYLRDGLACAYCGTGIEDGAKLTLDHVIPHSHGGNNKAENLITACHRCNSSRGNRPVEEFADKVAGYLNHGISSADILGHIAACLARPVDRKQAKSILENRGGFTAAMHSMR